MEPHHSGSHPDQSDSRWFRGEQQYPDPGGPPYEPRPDDTGYRTQDRWAGGRMPPPAQPGMGGPMGQWAGEPVHSMPAEAYQRDPAVHRDPTMTREAARAQGRAGAPADGRRQRRPATAAAIAITAAAVALPVLRVLLAGAFGPSPSAQAVISSVLVLLGLPLGAIGLHALATGATRLAGTPTPHAWLRPPLAYLTVALILFVAAGLAAS